MKRYGHKANIVLGLLGVLLAGIEIGKSATDGNLATAYTLAVGMVAALLTGNVETVLNAVGQQFGKRDTRTPEPHQSFPESSEPKDEA